MKGYGVYIDSETKPTIEQRAAAKVKLARLMKESGVESYSIYFVHAWDCVKKRPVYRMDANHE